MLFGEWASIVDPTVTTSQRPAQTPRARALRRNLRRRVPADRVGGEGRRRAAGAGPAAAFGAPGRARWNRREEAVRARGGQRLLASGRPAAGVTGPDVPVSDLRSHPASSLPPLSSSTAPDHQVNCTGAARNRPGRSLGDLRPEQPGRWVDPGAFGLRGDGHVPRLGVVTRRDSRRHGHSSGATSSWSASSPRCWGCRRPTSTSCRPVSP